MLQSMVTKHWPMTKVKSMFMATLKEHAAARTSRGWISLHTPSTNVSVQYSSGKRIGLVWYTKYNACCETLLKM